MVDAPSCAVCRSSLPIDAAFCPRCGGPRPPDPAMPIPRRPALRWRRWGRSVVRAVRGGTYCPACRSLAPADAAFCIRCAADLSPRRPPASPTAAGTADLPDLPAGRGWERLGDLAGLAAAGPLLLLVPVGLALGWLVVAAAHAAARLADAARRGDGPPGASPGCRTDR